MVIFVTSGDGCNSGHVNQGGGKLIKSGVVVPRVEFCIKLGFHKVSNNQ